MQLSSPKIRSSSFIDLHTNSYAKPIDLFRHLRALYTQATISLSKFPQDIAHYNTIIHPYPYPYTHTHTHTYAQALLCLCTASRSTAQCQHGIEQLPLTPHPAIKCSIEIYFRKVTGLIAVLLNTSKNRKKKKTKAIKNPIEIWREGKLKL
jgi:hypothetical protein